MLGYDIRRIAFEGPMEELTKTRVCQPAIFLHTMALFTLLKKSGILPELIAGHSLGEYSALVAAGATVIRLLPPLVISREDIDNVVSALEEIL